MYIADLFETYVTEAGPQLIVLYSGRFQPFHLGHGEVFQELQSRFGRDNVYIGTSNKTELPKSPFNFSEKVQFMHAAGIPSDRIIQVVSPYKLPEQFDPANTIFVVAVGAPDRDRLRPDSIKKDGNPGYFKTFEGLDTAQTADQHGYVIIADERQKVIALGGNSVDVSHGTPARAAWDAVRNDPKLRSEYLLQMYGRDDAELGRILDKIPQAVNENAPHVYTSAKFAHKDAQRLGKKVVRSAGGYFKLADPDTPGPSYVPNEEYLAKSRDLLKTLQLIDQEIEAKFEAPHRAERSALSTSLGPTDGGLWKSQEGKKRWLDGLDQLHLKYTYSTERKEYNKKRQQILNQIKQLKKTSKAYIEVNEEAAGAGVIANKKQARDPRYSMSLTRDVRPGEVGRQLRKMHLADNVQRLQEQIATLKEKWSAKYKRSINCGSPRGFSQRAHCQGRKK
jgi:hypothetical protein